MVGGMVVVGRVQTAGAQTDPTSCGHFESQKDAQEAFHSGELPNPENLDPDGDGIVCETRWGEVTGGPVAVDPTTCGHFETQADAQAALDSGGLPHPEYLDGDGDGIACEIRWADAGGEATGETVALPNTGSGAGQDARTASPEALLFLGAALTAIVAALVPRCGMVARMRRSSGPA